MKIILSGCTGSMGRVISEMVANKPDMEIVAGYAYKIEEGFSYPIYENIMDIREEGEVLLDFSSRNTLDQVLGYALEHRLPAVLCSTGYDQAQVEKIHRAAEEIPILFSGNMSIGINVLLKVVETLSRELDGFDIEIMEKHHNLKTDSPSGTANMLFDAANRGREAGLFKNEGRHGVDLKREENEVGMHALRGGTIAGEHSVIFAGLDEVIEVKHLASSKKIFAAGGLKACKFIKDKDKGLYDMRDTFL